MSCTSGAARKETSRCAHARGSTPRSPTTSSRSIACRPSSATHYDCTAPPPRTPAQPLLALDKTESAHILLRKKPAARHLFQPLVFSFVSIINVQTNRLPKKFKAALRKHHLIALNNSRDHYSRSKYTTQVLFSHTHGLLSGFLRCKNSCRNPFKIRQLLREV